MFDVQYPGADNLTSFNANRFIFYQAITFRGRSLCFETNKLTVATLHSVLSLKQSIVYNQSYYNLFKSVLNLYFMLTCPFSASKLN